MEYAWLVGVGLLMAAYQAIWWIVGIYLLIGVVLMYIWYDQDAEDHPEFHQPSWVELVIVWLIVVPLWPIAVFMRRAC